MSVNFEKFFQNNLEIDEKSSIFALQITVIIKRNTMKVTIIRKRGKNETITRHPVEDIALFIQKGWRKHTVTELREMYNLILKERQPDGQILTNWAGGIKLERLCFAQEFDKYKGEHRILGYNGLVVV